MERDAVDELLDQWRRERPDLDPSVVGVVGRLFRVSRRLDGAVEDLFQTRYGLQPGWFDLLASLRRSGEPYQLSPTALSQALMLTSGGMTKRLDRMEAEGLIRRLADPHDRRAMLVELTPTGREVVDAAVADHIANEERLLAGLSPAERRTLERLLRKLMRHLEQNAPAAEPATQAN
jgi:DNA-binding MarR family transcriptional regulator